MRILAAAALAGTILAGALSTTQAAVIAIPLIGGSGGASNTYNLKSGASGSFTDAFTFSVSSPSVLTYTMTSSGTGGTTTISSATFGLYKGTPDAFGAIGGATLVSPIAVTGTNKSKSGSDLGGFSLSAGNYFFELATSASNTGKIGSLTNSASVGVSAVPIPATLPMFGAALLGLGAAGFVMRRRKAPPSFA